MVHPDNRFITSTLIKVYDMVTGSKSYNNRSILTGLLTNTLPVAHLTQKKNNGFHFSSCLPCLVLTHICSIASSNTVPHVMSLDCYKKYLYSTKYAFSSKNVCCLKILGSTIVWMPLEWQSEMLNMLCSVLTRSQQDLWKKFDPT